MSNARNLANLLGTSTQIKTAKVADEVFQANESLIINGDMAIAQRGNLTGQTGGAYSLDRFYWFGGADETVSLSQSTDVPTAKGFTNSYKVEVTVADSSLGTSQHSRIEQRIEGQNLQHLKWGTSSAESVTASFWVKAPDTGNYVFTIYQDDGGYVQSKLYNITAANTWQFVTLTFDGNTGGTITDDNTIGLRVWWYLAAGTDLNSGSNDVWAASTQANWAANLANNFLDTVGNEFYLTGVKLEVGSVATPFRHENMAENLAKCHRYYYRIPAGNTYQRFGTGQNSSTTLCRMTPIFPVEMRVTPTIDTTGTAANYGVYEAGSVKTCTAIPVLSSSQSTNKIAEVYFTTNSLTAGRGAACLANNNNTVYLGYNAEL